MYAVYSPQIILVGDKTMPFMLILRKLSECREMTSSWRSIYVHYYYIYMYVRIYVYIYVYMWIGILWFPHLLVCVCVCLYKYFLSSLRFVSFLFFSSFCFLCSIGGKAYGANFVRQDEKYETWTRTREKIGLYRRNVQQHQLLNDWGCLSRHAILLDYYFILF